MWFYALLKTVAWVIVVCLLLVFSAHIAYRVIQFNQYLKDKERED